MPCEGNRCTALSGSACLFCCRAMLQNPQHVQRICPFPVIDAGIGSCSADFTITDSAGAPVYSASIKVHIAYGVMSLHKMDLEVGTNADGKARFTGLPDKTKQGLFFRVSEGDREGSAFDDPAKTCKAVFATPLEKKSK